MGTIKIELDLPEFEDSLDINVSLTKDKTGAVRVSPTVSATNQVVNYGQVIDNCSAPVDNIKLDTNPTEVKVNNMPNPFLNEQESTVSEKKPASKKKASGNMMNSDIF